MINVNNMKKTYITPSIHTYTIRAEKSLLAGSDISVGANNWSSGDEVLSRQGSGSFWDDDEE